MAIDAAHPRPDGAGAPDEELYLLDPEWDDTFAWSYGRLLWNVGCG